MLKLHCFFGSRSRDILQVSSPKKPIFFEYATTPEWATRVKVLRLARKPFLQLLNGTLCQRWRRTRDAFTWMAKTGSDITLRSTSLFSASDLYFASTFSLREQRPSFASLISDLSMIDFRSMNFTRYDAKTSPTAQKAAFLVLSHRLEFLSSYNMRAVTIGLSCPTVDLADRPQLNGSSYYREDATARVCSKGRGCQRRRSAPRHLRSPHEARGAHHTRAARVGDKATARGARRLAGCPTAHSGGLMAAVLVVVVALQAVMRPSAGQRSSDSATYPRSRAQKRCQGGSSANNELSPTSRTEF